MSDADAGGRGYMTDERKMMRDMAREFGHNEVLPIANKLDPEKGSIPQDLVDKMGELGFFGILIPEEYGGLGLGYFEILHGRGRALARMDECRIADRARQRHVPFGARRHERRAGRENRLDGAR